MQSFTYVITDEEGIHARPAGQLVKLAQTFESAVFLEKAGKQVSLKKLFALMGAGVKKGDEVTVSIEGNDEAAAAEAVERFFREHL